MSTLTKFCVGSEVPPTPFTLPAKPRGAIAEAGLARPERQRWNDS